MRARERGRGERGDRHRLTGGELSFEAGPGKANHVTVFAHDDGGESSPTQTEVKDTGAPLTAGEGCVSVDAHTAFCLDVHSVGMRLGDMDDWASAYSSPDEGLAGAVVFAGDGNDTVTAVAVQLDVFAGDGNDTVTAGAYGLLLEGGDGNDRLITRETGGARTTSRPPWCGVAQVMTSWSAPGTRSAATATWTVAKARIRSAAMAGRCTPIASSR